jgi:hypothetical protein
MRHNVGGVTAVNVAIPFSAAGFSANGGTWTVAAADVTNYEYTKIGSFYHLDLFMNGGTIAGNPANLILALPFTSRTTNCGFLVIDPTGNPQSGFLSITAGAAVARLFTISGGPWGNGVTPLSLEISVLQ